MANKKAALKSLRQDKKKNIKNASVKSELRTLVKEARELLSEKNKEKADILLKKLESKLKKAAQSNIIKKENASRRISRLRSQWAKIK